VVARISATVQTGPGAHPASLTMGTGSLEGVQRPGRGIDHSPHLAPRLKTEEAVFLLPPLGLRVLFYCELEACIQLIHGLCIMHSNYRCEFGTGTRPLQSQCLRSPNSPHSAHYVVLVSLYCSTRIFCLPVCYPKTYRLRYTLL